jgi:hypothetical protein
MAHVQLSLDEYHALMRLVESERESEGAVEQARAAPKKKRKVSRYQKEFGIQMKKLKKNHPRTKHAQLMAPAHIATRKALGMPRKRRG